MYSIVWKIRPYIALSLNNVRSTTLTFFIPKIHLDDFYKPVPSFSNSYDLYSWPEEYNKLLKIGMKWHHFTSNKY